MALRDFEDERGQLWSVWDTVPATTSALAGDFRGGWLTFDNGRERRRLAPLPEGWARLPPERLRLLLRVAKARGPRDPGPTGAEDEVALERRRAGRRVRDRRSGGRGGAPA